MTGQFIFLPSSSKTRVRDPAEIPDSRPRCNTKSAHLALTHSVSRDFELVLLPAVKINNSLTPPLLVNFLLKIR